VDDSSELSSNHKTRFRRLWLAERGFALVSPAALEFPNETRFRWRRVEKRGNRIFGLHPFGIILSEWSRKPAIWSAVRSGGLKAA